MDYEQAIKVINLTQTWGDLHGWDDNGDDYNGTVTRMASVYPNDPDETIEYLVTARVALYRDLPCQVVEYLKVERLEFDEAGVKEISRIEVQPKDFDLIPSILAKADELLEETI
jgi:hypothetical protein